jgi:hypothetical protein
MAAMTAGATMMTTAVAVIVVAMAVTVAMRAARLGCEAWLGERLR